MTKNICRNRIRRSSPLVSIIIPSYNHEKYIIECLESLRSLKYINIELIVSDDCSSDRTFSVLTEWIKDNKIRFVRTLVVRQHENLGIVKNLQYLFNAANGKYVGYIASDDIYLESAITERVNIFELNSNIDGIFGNAQYISEDGIVIREQYFSKWEMKMLSRMYSSRLFVSVCLLYPGHPGPVMMLRKTAIEPNGSLGILPPNLKAEDRYIYIRLAALRRLKPINTIVAKYRYLPGSMCMPLKPFEFNIAKVNLDADLINISVVSGINKLVMKNRIARNALEIRPRSLPYYRIIEFILRCVSVPFKVVLSIYAVVRVW